MRIQSSASDSFSREPALTVIGTWDPLLRPHRELFQKLAKRGRVAGLTPVVIVLFPSPAKYLQPGYREYSDLRARVALIRDCATAINVLTVRMTSRDLDASARSFFDLVSSYVAVHELWIGANQSLGRCRQGSLEAIGALARKRNIRLRRLEVCKECNAGEILRLLSQGKLRRAIKQVGLTPMWHRPKSGVLKLNWPPGEYLVVPTSGPSLAPRRSADPIAVNIVSREYGATMRWPAPEIEWLSFVAGPADR